MSRAQLFSRPKSGSHAKSPSGAQAVCQVNRTEKHAIFQVVQTARRLGKQRGVGPFGQSGRRLLAAFDNGLISRGRCSPGRPLRRGASEGPRRRARSGTCWAGGRHDAPMSACFPWPGRAEETHSERLGCVKSSQVLMFRPACQALSLPVSEPRRPTGGRSPRASAARTPPIGALSQPRPKGAASWVSPSIRLVHFCIAVGIARKYLLPAWAGRPEPSRRTQAGVPRPSTCHKSWPAKGCAMPTSSTEQALPATKLPPLRSWQRPA